MPEDFIYKINQLDCRYLPDKPVLFIPELEIPKGKLMFVLGVSGIGKSTFIETLGLMNNTIHILDKTSIKFNIGEGRVDEIRDIWSLDNNALSAFRNQHFSFIFQNTNLMPNFTAGENMCISMLIDGKKMEEVKSRVMNVMEKLNLSSDIYDRKVTELSGGQRQRLAFVRAIIAGFNVLFGDEPTGNLDQDTSFKLMNILKDNLSENYRTGIIVSHDIELALGFADIILLLTKDGACEEYRGTFLPQHYLFRTNGKWISKLGDTIKNPKALISDLMKK